MQCLSPASPLPHAFEITIGMGCFMLRSRDENVDLKLIANVVSNRSLKDCNDLYYD